MFSILLILTIIIFSSNSEFFEQVEKDRAKGAEWHYVGKSPPNSTSNSLPLYGVDGKPYIYYKLKMSKNK